MPLQYDARDNEIEVPDLWLRLEGLVAMPPSSL